MSRITLPASYCNNSLDVFVCSKLRLELRLQPEAGSEELVFSLGLWAWKVCPCVGETTPRQISWAIISSVFSLQSSTKGLISRELHQNLWGGEETGTWTSFLNSLWLMVSDPELPEIPGCWNRTGTVNPDNPYP